MATETEFYLDEAVGVYRSDLDFSVLEDSKPLASLEPAVKEVLSWVAQTLVAVGCTVALSIAPGGLSSSYLSEPPEVAQENYQGVDGQTMTAIMQERAELASRIFQRTPHPGADDPDPDYGL